MPQRKGWSNTSPLPAHMQPSLFVGAGERYGQGVVIDPLVRIPRTGKPKSVRGAKLLCDCGTEYITPIGDLLRGKVKSCGCRKRDRSIDRTGQRYGRLVVVRRIGSRRHGSSVNALWLCRCDCGKETEVEGGSLANGTAASCGCSRRQPRNADTPGRAARNRVLNGYQGGARHRGLVWELTDDDFDRLTSQNCFYCGLPPSTVRRAGLYEGGEFVHNGIDRVDSTRGYTPDNVLPCCEICNRAKMDRPFDDFMAWIARLTEYHWFHPEMTPSHLLKGGV